MRRTQLEALRIVAVREPEGLRSDVDFDPYIPFRFRTSQRPVGASFIRLGDLKRTLLELAVDPANQMLTGVTLTSVARVEAAVAPPLDAVRRGLPLLSTTFALGAQVVNLGSDFQVAIGADGLLIHWGDLTASTTALEWGRMRFLIAEDHLVGIWCRALSDVEMANFHAAARG